MNFSFQSFVKGGLPVHVDVVDGELEVCWLSGKPVSNKVLDAMTQGDWDRLNDAVNDAMQAELDSIGDYKYEQWRDRD